MKPVASDLRGTGTKSKSIRNQRIEKRVSDGPSSGLVAASR
jgi:hypothetical protein